MGKECVFRAMASSDPSKRPRPGPWPPGPESAAPMPPSSWAKRTGFRPKFSGETNATDSGPISVQPQPKPREPDANIDLESGRARPLPTANGEVLSPVPEKPAQEKDKEKPVRKRRDSDGGGGGAAAPPAAAKGPRANGQAPQSGEAAATVAGAGNRRGSRSEEVVDLMPRSVVDDDGFISRHSHMKYELRDSPGLGELC